MLDTPAQHRWNRERLISSGDRDERGMSGRRVSSGPGQRHFRLHGVGDAVGHAGVQRRSTDVDDTRRARPPDPTDALRFLLRRTASDTYRTTAQSSPRLARCVHHSSVQFTLVNSNQASRRLWACWKKWGFRPQRNYPLETDSESSCG